MSDVPRKAFKVIYDRLYARFGPQQWWPARSRFEVMLGAILTQNTNWGNVERALANLKRRQLMSIPALTRLPLRQLSLYLKPAGYFNVKARRVKNFLAFVNSEYGGSLERMQKDEPARLRERLLSVNGIGPETADSILLYAFNKPYFVIDAYTKRVLYRHNLAPFDADYHQLQNIFMKAFPRRMVKLYNEYHALFVRVGKQYCRPTPRCQSCPLNNIYYSQEHKCPACHRSLGKAYLLKQPSGRNRQKPHCEVCY